LAATQFYPVHLRVAGQAVLVVGGGPVAAAKAQGLAEAGAAVRVVASEAGPDMRALVASGAVTLMERRFRPEDLEGCRLVVAATDDPELHAAVYDLAEARGTLVCCVDDPERSNWIAPAVLRRGELIVTVSTSGIAPALAATLRDRLSEVIGEPYGRLLAELRGVRAALRARCPDPEGRRAAWRRLLGEAVLPALERGEVPLLDERALDRAAGIERSATEVRT
jgi:precorrin-2 dehydrogenase/sirohydrochlorin ferrochelatase